MTAEFHRWLLPEGIDETLPPDGWRVEELRRRVLDLFRERGYELYLPPLVEYLDALLTGSGGDLDLQTFRLTDQMSGRMLGVRADITQQAARADAHGLADEVGAVRLCYVASVLRARPEVHGGTRCPKQIGCELFGNANVEADIEVIRLMLDTLTAAGVADLQLDLGHVGIFRKLMSATGLNDADAANLFDRMRRNSAPDVADFLREKSAVTPQASAALQAVQSLLDCCGEPDILSQQLGRYSKIDDSIDPHIQKLQSIVVAIEDSHPNVPIHIDLAELRGYRYHTGTVFAAYVPGEAAEVARGGRYDHVGAEFESGAGRPATGFSSDLNTLLRLQQKSSSTN